MYMVWDVSIDSSVGLSRLIMCYLVSSCRSPISILLNLVHSSVTVIVVLIEGGIYMPLD